MILIKGKRKMRKKLYFVLAIFLILAPFLTGCNNANHVKTLRVGVRDNIVNFGYLNEISGKYYGLEVDIATELANRLGYGNVEFTTVTPDNRKQMLLDGNVDCLIACYSISDTRIENFDFSPAYYTDNICIMVENSSMIEKIEDLQNKKIGVMSGSNTAPILAIKLQEIGMIQGELGSKVTGVEALSDTDEATVFNGMYFKKENNYNALSDDLEVGTVDAVAMDGAITKTYKNDERNILDFNVSEQQYGVATQKGSELSAQVSEKIQEMLDDGTIEVLKDKWD
ncbi:amino acid ABC transporter substrate-binding protein [Eubacterium maltosivorans]|uniref:Amino acid ABC transporter substrate-binding protein n=2 Tax=Eubacteriaceae TaxID=186806 RepID=A0A4P9CAU7_EUBML|nr:amino acid ABC transporter substrate-binding protein [Eubacterium maltosivorans]